MTHQRSTLQLRHATSKLDSETGNPQNKPTLCTAAVAGFATGDEKAAAIREAVELADRQFSNWDWVAVQRAGELSLGALGPDDVRLCFAESATPFEVPDPIHAWIVEDVRRRPRFEVTPVGHVTAPMTGTFVPEAEPPPLAYRDMKSRSKD